MFMAKVWLLKNLGLTFDLPRYLTSLAEFRANNHDTRSQNKLALKVYHTNTELEQTGFWGYAPNYLNELQHSLKSETPIPLRDFKALLA